QEDRRHVPTGVETVTAEGSEKTPMSPEADRAIFLPGSSEATSRARPQAASQAAATAPSELSVVQVKSTPEGADITVDGKYVGSTPSSLRLTSGDHQISIEKAGFKLWQRTLTVHPGGNITIDATLEKLP
ncbi:MAG: PEGA domain-containing protein, partial [Acidobacteria bacterium]|nr:PEGA domain-containing protein [Acidobacteriota bacterium]